MASTNNFVDLSTDNDNNVVCNTSTSQQNGTPFERSCDNPECSAPKLIAKVPKQAISEFITEPKVVAKPTIINGFTTIFQVDGHGTKMEDLMNEYAALEHHPGGRRHRPKTVFRVVPNTHAHIVNYVVVESASETLQKIKENDTETMRKLLVSQRLSAEQMLKKLIGKALETPSRPDRPAPLGPAVPAQAPAPIPTAPIIPTTAPSVPVSTPRPLSVKKVTPVITPTPLSVLTSPMPVTPPVPTTPKVPSGITIKLLANTDANKTPSASQLTAAMLNAFSTPEQANPTAMQSIATNESTPRQSSTVGGSRVIAASKPVVWQAVPSQIASKSSANFKQTISPPPKRTQPVMTSPTKLANSSVNNIQQPQPKPTTSNQSNALKRTRPESLKVVQIPETLKKLRVNRTRTQTMTPLADKSVLPLSKDIPSPTHKRTLPTLPKDRKTGPPRIQDAAPKALITPKPIEQLTTPDSGKPSVLVSSSPSTVSLPSSPPSAVTPTTVSPQRKKKPLMGPASKMRALRSKLEAKNNESESTPLKIGETFITKTITPKVVKAPSPLNVPDTDDDESVTKPCSVAVTDIAKNSTTIDSDSESVKTRSSRLALRSSFEKDKDAVPKASQALIDKLKGRVAVKKVQDERSSPMTRAARSAAAAVAAAKSDTEATDTEEHNRSSSALLTSPSAPSRVLRVVLPSQKNGVINNPPTSPHPNLKISSVISGGTHLPSSLDDFNDDSDPGIEQLQKELADLRRTVARLTQGKPK